MNSHIDMIGIEVSKAIGIINHLKSIYPQRVLCALQYILLWGKSDNKLLNYKRELYARYHSVDQLHILNHCSKHSIF